MDAAISLVKAKERIVEAMRNCADSFFDQSINNLQDIYKLAEKFQKYGIVYAAYLEGIPIGLIAFYCNDTETYQAYLSMIVVKDTYHNLGVGGVLLRAMIRLCTEKMFKTVKLEVNITNTKAITFYKHKGFVRSEAASDKTDYYILTLA